MPHREFLIEDGVLTGYRGPGGHVVIPAEVRRIGDNAFEGCDSLQTVRIPQGVTKIGYGAFLQCENLTGAEIPGSVEQIGGSAFACCHRLADVRLGEGVRQLGRNAFFNCFALTRITLPQTLESFQADAFGCHRSFEIRVDPANRWYCSRDRLVFSKDMKQIVFAPRDLTRIALPEGLEVIGDGAFAGCSALAEVAFPASLREIGALAFMGCRGLRRAALPAGLEFIGDQAFAGCDALAEFHMPARARLRDHVFDECDFRHIAPKIPLHLLQPDEKPQLIQGFASAWCARNEIDPEIQAEYLKYIRGQRKRLYRQALQHPPLLQLMTEEKIIPKIDIQTLLELADRQQNTAARQALLLYFHRAPRT